MNLTTRCPHCGNPRQRHHHESPWCDDCFRSLFERLDRLEAIAAAQSTPSSPANAPEVPQGQTGDSDGTERNRVSLSPVWSLSRRGAVYVSGLYAGMASCDGQPVDDCGCGAMPMTAPDHACNAWEARTDG